MTRYTALLVLLVALLCTASFAKKGKGKNEPCGEVGAYECVRLDVNCKRKTVARGRGRGCKPGIAGYLQKDMCLEEACKYCDCFPKVCKKRSNVRLVCDRFFNTKKEKKKKKPTGD